MNIEAISPAPAKVNAPVRKTQGLEGFFASIMEQVMSPQLVETPANKSDLEQAEFPPTIAGQLELQEGNANWSEDELQIFATALQELAPQYPALAELVPFPQVGGQLDINGAKEWVQWFAEVLESLQVSLGGLLVSGQTQINFQELSVGTDSNVQELVKGTEISGEVLSGIEKILQDINSLLDALQKFLPKEELAKLATYTIPQNQYIKNPLAYAEQKIADPKVMVSENLPRLESWAALVKTALPVRDKTESLPVALVDAELSLVQDGDDFVALSEKSQLRGSSPINLTDIIKGEKYLPQSPETNAKDPSQFSGNIAENTAFEFSRQESGSRVDPAQNTVMTSPIVQQLIRPDGSIVEVREIPRSAMGERVEEIRILRQLADKVQLMVRGAQSTMTMQLYPEHLGRVDLRLEMNEGVLYVQIKVETDAARVALENQSGNLREAVESHKISVEKMEVLVERDRTGERNQERQDLFRRKKKQNGGEEKIFVVELPGSQDTGRRLGYNSMEMVG